MSNVQLSVTPNEALVDEKVNIRVDGLPKNGPITIKASLQEGSLRFSSYGCYTATDEGSVVVGEQKSQLGTYTGVYKFVFCPEPKAQVSFFDQVKGFKFIKMKGQALFKRR